ncbi:RNA polymerase I specific transcription initiation factor [Colletotrichum graminicola]|uniref:RNA polymerase I specific transcription initiation factor n=1 Tax=Colletotrichum graminicola (strain M1.001 / M2 / FGSC 10212) TaxID=645133 RepID=E3Q3K8_COLGM|nr:RNA polymerase I specific transcription initiation factor [Colletotrichum graminicola M1.001]EFQ25610.1 RNA polymerase I specific transcription initiation factor [Colletotrichum graminicola M1.001]WDK11060.1 RNA polymerase I specific transcription initiation factor [Colletotrichum graminicola]
MAANEESWDLDTDEIRSVDSEELYETRPNRWKGNRSTWYTYTQEERLLYRSMEKERDRDLSVHLYNAFALKHRPVRPTATAEPDAEDADRPLEEIVDSGEWRPPSLWTAWPMNPQTVPGDDFLKETHDEDDNFTIRHRQAQLPSTALEEELTATILRQAKERFQRRQRKYQEKEAARAQDDTGRETTEPSCPSAASSDDEKDVLSDEGETKAEPDEDAEIPKRAKTYEAVVSADDDLSADLLRPSVRHILSTLDNTLAALHNARLAGLSYMTDSSASATEGDASDAFSDGISVASAVSRASSATRRQRKGAPRSKAPRTPEPERPSTERRGRPRKALVPLPGETEKEMKIRIARERKKRIPYSSDEEVNDGKEGEGERKEPETEAEAETSRSRSPRKKRDLPPETRAGAKIRARESMLGSWGLRDWSDVMGAASLAGFKPEVVARAAQRCADLFGQGMEMQTLLEGPPSERLKPQGTRYLPGSSRRQSPSLSSSDSEVERPALRRRVVSRQGSLARDSVPPSDSDATRGRGSRTPSRGRSTSRTSSVGLFFCPVAGCPRAAEGFGRRTNLQRHVARFHPGQAVEVDVESEDEMFGAVHVDGFLKPIRARKGWRAEDTGTRKRKRHYRGRRVDESDASDRSGVGEESVWDSS